MTFRYGEPVTIQTAGTITDPYSLDPTSAWVLGAGEEWTIPPSEVVVDGVLVGSGGSTEPREVARNAVDSDFDLIFQPPYTALPTAQNRVVVRGLVCEVDGRPFEWKWAASPGDAGTIVRVSIREG